MAMGHAGVLAHCMDVEDVVVVFEVVDDVVDAVTKAAA